MGGVRHISRYLWQAKYRRSRFKLIENVRTRIYHLQISEQSPSSYHRRRCKDPRLCCRLAARVSFCQHWHVQLQGYENEYILLGAHKDHCRSSWSLSIRVERYVGTIWRLLRQPHGAWIYIWAIRFTLQIMKYIRESNGRGDLLSKRLQLEPLSLTSVFIVRPYYSFRSFVQPPSSTWSS